MFRHLLLALAVLAVFKPLEAVAQAPFACEVTRPVAEEDTLRRTMSALLNSTRRRAVGPGPVEIDVMEVYGPQLLHEAGDAETARVLIQHQVDSTNVALRDSGLANITLRLRHARFSTKYDSFQTATAGPEIDQDQRYYGADLLGFMVGTTPLGITAAACRPPSYGPFCGRHWVQASNLLQSPVPYVHELGHNLGADHDAPNAMARDVDPHPYARAHCVPGQWRTVMSYGSPCLANVVLLFSNPLRTFRGLSTGVENEEDNARVIALSAPLVRDYFPATENSGPRCEFRITYDSSEVPVAGTTRELVAERVRGDCEPAIASLDEWVRIELSPGSTNARAEGLVTYLANDQPLSRRGHFVVGEQPVSVEQAGAGACLMENGAFDHEISGWTERPFAVGRGTMEWSPVDAKAKPDSGSAMISTRGGSFGVERCVAVDPSAHYVLRSSVFMPTGQTIGAQDLPAFQSVSLFETSDCSGPDSGFGQPLTYIEARWLQSEVSFNTAATAHSAKISLNVNVAGHAFTTLFDNVHLCRTGNAQ
jgi:hypothetical protein